MYSTLETKFAPAGEHLTLNDETRIEGYASLFNEADQSGDVVLPGAFAAALEQLKSQGRHVKMLWQHDPHQPIGVWDEVREDHKGLFVRGRLLPGVQKGAEAMELIGAGAIDGLSIGYKTRRSEKKAAGRHLAEVDLWEVSLVTFPMLPQARVAHHPQDQTTPVDAALIPQMVDMLRAGTQALRQDGLTDNSTN